MRERFKKLKSATVKILIMIKMVIQSIMVIEYLSIRIGGLLLIDPLDN